MQLILHLLSNVKTPIIPINYNYYITSAIYKCISNSDNKYAQFLHNQGYGVGHKNFKFFTFSELLVSYNIKEDRMILKDKIVKLKICFYLNEALKPFISGVFKDQIFKIGDKKSSVEFSVTQIELNDFDIVENQICLYPQSCIVAGIKNERGYYDYKNPNDPVFIDCLKNNLLQKYKALKDIISENELNEIEKKINIKIDFFFTPPKSKLITIKEGSKEETKIKGFKNFKIYLQAPKIIIQLALNCGLGLNNSLGFGCVEEFKSN